MRTQNLGSLGSEIKYSLSANYIDEVEVDVVPLDVCGVVFGSPYMYMRDAIFLIRENQYCLIKDGTFFMSQWRQR